MKDVRLMALTIAGLDPSGGAGIIADVKTFAAHGVYGMCCVTALTVQSTQGVRRTVAVEAALLTETLRCLFEDVPPRGVKIGMMGTGAAVEAIAAMLEEVRYDAASVVLDPVLRSSSGTQLLDEDGVLALRDRLLVRTGWITPNVDELGVLVGEKTAGADGIPEQARRLQELARTSGNDALRVVVTGGHLEEPDDYFLDAAGKGTWIRGRRVRTSSTHGTGCAYSSALLCRWMQDRGNEEQAVVGAKAYVTAALEGAYPVGRGKGPLNHLFRLPDE